MIRKTLPLLLVTLLSTLGSVAWASAKVDSLLQLSGLPVQLEGLPTMVKLQVQQHPDLAGDNLKTIMLKADEQVLPSVVLAQVADELEKSLSEAQLDQLLAWYRSDLGRQIVAAEEHGASAEAYQAISSQAETLLADRKRVQTALHFDQLLGGTEKAMELHEYTAVAVAVALRSATNPGQPVDQAQVLADFETIKPQVRDNMEQNVALNFIYTYRDTDDATLARYEAFLKTPAAKAFNDATLRGIYTGLQQVVDAWAAELSAVFSEPAPAE